MKTYIINLEKSLKRRLHIVSEVERTGLEYEIIKAVDGSQLSALELSHLCDMDQIRRFPQWLSPGAIGAALSHRKVYGRIIENDDPFALVVEDDAILPDHLPELLISMACSLKRNEVALLYYSSFTPLVLSNQNCSPLIDEMRLMYPMFLNGVGGAVCYVITRDAAESLFNNLMPISLSSDSWLNFVETGLIATLRCLHPTSVDHLGVKSTISSTSQTFFRRWLSEVIDRYELPVANEILKRSRRKSLQARRNVTITNSRSPFDASIRTTTGRDDTNR